MSGGGPQGLGRLSQCLPCGRRVLPGLFQLAAVHVGRDGVRRLFQRTPRPGQCIRQGLSRLSQRRFVAAVPQNAGDLRQRVASYQRCAHAAHIAFVHPRETMIERIRDHKTQN